MSKRKKTARRRRQARSLSWRDGPQAVKDAISLLRRRLRQADDALAALEILSGEIAGSLAGIAQTAPRVAPPRDTE